MSLERNGAKRKLQEDQTHQSQVPKVQVLEKQIQLFDIQMEDSYQTGDPFPQIPCPASTSHPQAPEETTKIIWW